MTQEQLSKLDYLNQQANDAYSKMDERQVDYDTFKQIAEASSIKSYQSKKIYDNLYDRFITYPNFLNSLKLIYLDAKAESDEYNAVLKEKLDELNIYKSAYNAAINNINVFQVEVDINELGNSLQDIANNPNSLRFSYELVAAKDSADYLAKIKADLEAQAAAQASIGKISGVEACLDKNGKQVSMSICRPSSGGGRGGGGTNVKSPPTAQEIASKKISDWIDIANAAVKSIAPTVPAPVQNAATKTIQVETPEEIAAKEEVAAKAKLAAEIEAAAKAEANKIAAEAAAKAKEEADKIAAEEAALKVATSMFDKLPVPTAESALNSFVFKVDLGKLTNDLNLARSAGIPSPRQQAIISSLCSVINGRISNPSSVTNNMLWSQYIYQFDVTPEEIAIARAYCPESEEVKNFYNQEEIKSYDPLDYDVLYSEVNVYTPYEPTTFKVGDQVDLIDLTPLSNYYIYGKIYDINWVKENGYVIKISVYGYDGLSNNSNRKSSKWKLVIDTTGNDLQKIGSDKELARKVLTAYPKARYKGNWMQYKNYYINDVINFDNKTYIAIQNVFRDKFWYHPTKGDVLGSYWKPISDINVGSTSRQEFINNGFCSVKDGVLINTIWDPYPFFYDREPNDNDIKISIQRWGGAGAITWNQFKITYRVTPEEEAIARAICTSSELSSSYYKKTFAGFDGSIKSSNSNLNNILFLLAGVSAIFLVKNMLKNK
jgi:hypothetical protein